MASKIRIELLCIDPQVDFMDLPGSALPVPGADEDTKRLATFVRRMGKRLDDIHVTLDSPHLMHVANPIMWLGTDNRPPQPFTTITEKDIRDGVWRARFPSWHDWMLAYVQTLAKNGRYQLMIWPPHCLIGSDGTKVHPDLFTALREWEQQEVGMVDFVTKGSNYKTEHYSAVQAEVVDPNDPTTSLNIQLIKTLEQADIVLIAGEALSHCVANTVRDIANNFSRANVEKIHLLRDCSSSVANCDALSDAFIRDLTQMGMKVVNSSVFAL